MHRDRQLKDRLNSTGFYRSKAQSYLAFAQAANKANIAINVYKDISLYYICKYSLIYDVLNTS